MSDTEQTEQKAEAAEQAQGGAGEPGEGRQPEPSERSALDLDLEELVNAAAKRDEYLALAQRTQADFENYRRRVARESAAAQQRGVAKLVKELLPALDNLDRAIATSGGEDPDGSAADRDADTGGGEDSSLLHGVRLVRGEMHAALARLGVESFSPKGQPFDPAEHEAMAQQPVDGARSGEVAEVFQPGWRMGSEVIRPARVLVAA